MKRTILFLCLVLFAVQSAMAQYAASASGSTTAAAEINSKPATQTGAGVPSGNCTAGKDFYLNTTAHTMYACTQTNTWSALASATNKMTATFLLGAGGCYADETTNWPWVVPCGPTSSGTTCVTQAHTIVGCSITAAQYPTGADLDVNIYKNPTVTDTGGTITLSGGTSIFASTALVLPASGTATTFQAAGGAGATLASEDQLWAKVTQAGSTLPGQFVSVVCTVTY